MGKSFTPTVASSNTSSSVKPLPTPSVKLAGTMQTMAPSRVSGTQSTGHSSLQKSFAQPTHSYGNSTIAMTHEQRTGELAHIAMIPKLGK